MRIRRFAAGAALVALALAMTGCGRSAPPITDAQVEEWRALAAETIPLATDITVEADTEATMAASVNLVFVTVHFATFTDLKASEDAVASLDAAIDEQAGGAAVTTEAVHDGAEAFEAQVVAHLLAGVSGLESVNASSSVVALANAEGHSLWVTVYVYATDPAAIDPPWLDDVSDITQQVASDAGGQIYSVVILPADAAALDVSSPELDNVTVPVSSLQAFKQFGVDNGCVRTDTWAYDVSNAWAIVYPAKAPEGACA